MAKCVYSDNGMENGSRKESFLLVESKKTIKVNMKRKSIMTSKVGKVSGSGLTRLAVVGLLGGVLGGLSLSSPLMADPCCVQQSSFTNASTSVAIHETSGVSEQFLESGGFSTESTSVVGVETTIQSDLQLYNVPLYHSLPFSLLGGEEFLNVAVLLPYVINEVGLNDEKGIGDLYLGGQYYRGKGGIVRKVGVGLKLPTGNHEKGLGTDSTDFSVFGRIAKRINDYTLSLGAAYTFKGSTGDDFIDYGNQFTVKGGYQYHVNRDVALSSGLVLTRQENNQFGDDDAGFRAQGYLAYDLQLGVSYRFRRNLLLRADVGLPLGASTLDQGDDPDRETTLRLNISTNY